MAKDSIKLYVNQLASKEPVPGGGSASALVAALGAGLLEKACNLTIGKEKFKQKEAEFVRILKIIAPIRKRLIELIEEDQKGYLPLAKANKMPRNTSQQEIYRKKCIQRALKGAIKVPKEIKQLSDKLLRYCEKIESDGNPSLIGDVRCAKVLLEAVSKSSVNFFGGV